MTNEELLVELRELLDEQQEQANNEPIFVGRHRKLEALKQLIREKQYAIEGPRLDGGKCNCCERGGEYNGFASGPLLFVCANHCMCHD